MPLIPSEFAASIANPMGFYYLLASIANGAAVGHAWQRKKRLKSLTWLVFALGFGLFCIAAFRGHPLEMPAGLKTAIDRVGTPAAISVFFFAMLLLLSVGREFFVKPTVAWCGFNAAVVFFGASLADPNFFAAVMRPDDLPIVAMVFLLGYFVWLAIYQAVENDRRSFSPLFSGEGSEVRAVPIEKGLSRKFLVWPDLVYPELICMILLSTVLIVWSLLVRAPLEQPANPAITPNPAKAPWYFVGLQELLMFSDAWNMGVVVPALAILGLAAIPYLDRNPAGSGYYSIRGRRFAVFFFLFGFLQLWILPILIGTFLRGPNWSAFGLYEVRDPSKLITHEHLSLAQIFWTNLLHHPLPQSPNGSGSFVRLLYFFYRNIAGVCLTFVYFVALPMILRRTLMKKNHQSLGSPRFYLFMFMLLYMLTLPVKMAVFWLFGLDSLFG